MVIDWVGVAMARLCDDEESDPSPVKVAVDAGS